MFLNKEFLNLNMQTVDEKTIILIGENKSGKRHFVKSLELLELMTFGTPIQSSSREPYENLKGNKSDQEFEVLLPSYSKSYDAIKLKIIICRSIKFGDMKENLESIKCLIDYKYDFNSIFFFFDGTKPRIRKESKECLENLLSIYGESLVEFVTIIQSFSNRIEDKLCPYESCTDSNDLEIQKKKIEDFYSNGIKDKRGEFYTLLEKITSKINERFPCENFSRFQEMVLNKVAYVQFGEIKLREKRNEKNKTNEKNEKNYEVVKSSIPLYSKSFLDDYKSKFSDNPEDFNWVNIFIERIFSLKDTFSFQKIEDQINEIKRLTKERRENLEIDKIAFDKAVSSLGKSEKSSWIKSAFRNISIGVPVALKQLNSLSNVSLLTSLAQDNGTEILQTLRALNDSYRSSDNEAEKFDKLMTEFEKNKIVEKVKRKYNLNPEA